MRRVVRFIRLSIVLPALPPPGSARGQHAAQKADPVQGPPETLQC